MEQITQFVRGPLFIMTFTFMVLGLLRLITLQVASGKLVSDKVKDKDVNYGSASFVAGWFAPVKFFFKRGPMYIIVSAAWHIFIVITPLLLVDHILLWGRGFGISLPMWLAIPKHMADMMASFVIILSIILMVMWKASGEEGGVQSIDYLFMLLLLTPFVTGIMAAHPSIAILKYESLMLVHILSAEAIFVLLPFTRMSYALMHLVGRIAGGAGKPAVSIRGEGA